MKCVYTLLKKPLFIYCWIIFAPSYREKTFALSADPTPFLNGTVLHVTIAYLCNQQHSCLQKTAHWVRLYQQDNSQLSLKKGGKKHNLIICPYRHVGICQNRKEIFVTIVLHKVGLTWLKNEIAGWGEKENNEYNNLRRISFMPLGDLWIFHAIVIFSPSNPAFNWSQKQRSWCRFLGQGIGQEILANICCMKSQGSCSMSKEPKALGRIRLAVLQCHVFHSPRKQLSTSHICREQAALAHSS